MAVINAVAQHSTQYSIGLKDLILELAYMLQGGHAVGTNAALPHELPEIPSRSARGRIPVTPKMDDTKTQAMRM